MRPIDAHRVENLLQMCGTYHGVIAYDTVISILHDVPTVDVPDTNVGKWIPVTDRLPEDSDSEYSYQQYCGFRLPCGVCTRTNSACPINGYTVMPTWGSPTITCSASTGNPISVEALKFDSTTACINKEA